MELIHLRGRPMARGEWSETGALGAMRACCYRKTRPVPVVPKKRTLDEAEC